MSESTSRKGPYHKFYPAIIERVIKPAILSIIEEFSVTSKHGLWKEFRDKTDVAVSEIMFSRWLNDSGITFERTISVSINGGLDTITPEEISPADPASAMEAISQMVGATSNA